MIEVIDKEILDELRDVAKRFKNEESMLDPQAMRSDFSLRGERFSTEFPEAMAEFRRLDLTHKGEYDYEYSTACKEFLDLVSIGKSNKIIVKRSEQQEISRLKERCHSLESKERQNESKIRQLEDELKQIKILRDAAIRANPFLESFFKTEDSKVEEKDEQSS